MAIAKNIQHPGGQHRAPVGTSTIHGETPAERAERHRRAYAELREWPAFPVEGFDTGDCLNAHTPSQKHMR